MKKPDRSRRDPRNVAPRNVSERALSEVIGGTAEGTVKLGNKVWQDDWLAPV